MSVSESEFNQAASAADDARSAPERSRAETRRRLIAAGTELFASGGLHAVTSARIARRAGVATGTFYLHFKDKKALFREIVFAALERLRARQREAARAARNPAEELRARTGELLAFAEENRDLVRVLFGRGHEGAELGEAVLDHFVPGVESRLRERAALGEVASDLHASVAAQAVTGMLSRVIAWWVEDPARAPREAVLDTLLRLHPLHAAPGGDVTDLRPTPGEIDNADG